MKGPVTGIEVRYRITGTDDESGWTYLKFPKGAGISLRGLTPGETYDIGIRFTGPVPSAWTTTSHAVATTTRTGMRALPPGSVGNVGAIWDTGAEATWTATDTLADISVTAGDLLVGDDTVSYSASTAQLAGTAEEVKTVHLYYDDPKWSGGLRTLGVTDSLVTARTGHTRIYIATLTITFDVAAGSGTGGGGGIGGGGGGSGQIEP